MTTYPPERIIIDVETEGEFLTGDDQPTPNTDTDAKTGPADTGPGLGLGVRLATATLHLARREYAVLRTGLTILKTETGTWAAASEETPAHLRASLLNRRYSTWQAKQNAEIERLEEKAGELEKQARRAAAAGQSDDATAADHKQAGAAAATLREEAAAWRQRVRDIHAQPYTGHIDPSDAELEHHRRRTAHKRRAALATLTLAIGGLELAIGSLLLPALTAAGIALTGWAKARIPGWRRALPDVPPLAYEIESGRPAQDKQPKDKDKDKEKKKEKEKEKATPTGGVEPFPIAQATTAEEAGTTLLQALLGEGLAVGAVTDVTHEKWGWKATAHLTKGKPSALVLRLPELDVALGVRAGGVMAQPQSAAAGSVVLRVLLGDPFDPMPAHPVHAPRSNSILKPCPLGPSMDGTPTQVTLAGQNVMVIAVPGGGKSMIVRSMADYITSCTDAIVIDIDPTGRGLGPLRRLAAMRAYDEERIDDTLDWAIREAEIRTERMGDDVDNWQVTEDDPAVFVLVDEHPQLTPKQKQKVIKLGRIGRKARVTVILLSQDATSDVVGDAIADVFGIRIMLPSRKADVPLVVGSDTAISEGWMPHRLTPSPGDWDPADAGCYYILAPGLRDPILRKATHLDAPTATLRTQERLAAGIPEPVPHPEPQAEEVPVPEIVAVLFQALDEEKAECITLDQLHPHLIAHDPKRWDRWHDKDVTARLREIGKNLGNELRKAGIELSTERLEELDGSPRGIRRTDLLTAAAKHAEQHSE
ncbi:hypothetical protein ACIRST_38500 [Kitasatospora sp. NPDC101447]|uniref:hypothetical protein n=1 Tax=Kitasatospora sp. NPDC101447 TaxID=3364102 RepID=UPI00382FBDEA